MFDNRKVAYLADLLPEFIKIYPDIFLYLDEVPPDIFPLLHRLNANVKAILVDSEVSNPQTFFNVPVLNFQAAVPYFNYQTAIIRVAKKISEPPVKELTLQSGNIKKSLSLLEISFDEAAGVYDRLIFMKTFKELEADGLNSMYGVLHRTARGFSTFTNTDSYMKIMYTAPPQLLKFDIDDVGIVIQGPLMHENNYTLTTAQMYRRLYPNIPVVISTWKNEADGDFRKACKANSIVLLENTPPQDRGYLNVNLQLESSFQGVNYIKNHTDAQFVLKTRSDQRIYRPDFLLYFKNLIKAFPPYGDKLTRRLISLAGHTRYLIPFFVCDFMLFGHISDIKNFYGIVRYPNPEDKNSLCFNDKRFLQIANLLDRSKLNFYEPPSDLQRQLTNLNRMTKRLINPEIYMMKTFYQENIATINYKKYAQTYWQFLRDYLILADNRSILFEWVKYEQSRYNVLTLYRYMDHSKWLHLYNNFDIDRI